MIQHEASTDVAVGSFSPSDCLVLSRAMTVDTFDPTQASGFVATAYELATGRRLASADFEGGKSAAVKVLGILGFTVRHNEGRLSRSTGRHCPTKGTFAAKVVVVGTRNLAENGDPKHFGPFRARSRPTQSTAKENWR